MAGQKQNGSTVNVTISMNAAGLMNYSFLDPFDISINLGKANQTPIVVSGSANDDRILLDNSSGNTIYGNNGNDIFVVGKNAASLGGNVLRGGTGVNIIQVDASNATIDLTRAASSDGLPSLGIEAVVANKAESGETVNLSFGNLTSSDLDDGGAGPGRAFVALIGRDGQVNFASDSNIKLLGVLNAAGQGFAADGTLLDTADTAALAAEETPIDDVQGTLAKLYTASSPASQHIVPNNLSAYLFSGGSKVYTLWTDGTVTQSSLSGGASNTIYQPAPVMGHGAPLGLIPTFNSTGSGYVTLTQTQSGATSLTLGRNTNPATGAIVLKNGVSGVIVHGGDGANGGDWFGLAGSGGGNLISGTPAGDLFDLGGGPALIDLLHGNGGFNIVRAGADGVDVDLTSNNAAAGGAAVDIQAVVGAVGTTSDTVEVSLSNLAVSNVQAGGTTYKTSVFEALLGSSSDTLTLSGTGNWVAIATNLTPGGALPTAATALTNASVLDPLFDPSRPKNTDAENAVVGTLYALENAKGTVISRYATVWTDATSVTQFAQAAAQAPASPAISTFSAGPFVSPTAPGVLAGAHA